MKLLAQDGSIKTAGVWVLNEKRNSNNPQHYHSTAFYDSIYPSKWWKMQGIELQKEKTLESQLGIISEKGMILLQNLKEGRASDGMILHQAWMTTPAIEKISEEQKQALSSLYEEIKQLGKDYITINCIRDYESMDVLYFYTVDEFYDAAQIKKGKESGKGKER